VGYRRPPSGRWREIFTLNRGRPQPGGQRLSDPDLIYPGWLLRLPARHTAPPGHSPGAPGPRRPHPGPGRTPGPGHPPPSHRTVPAPRLAPGIGLPGGGLAPIALAAAISAAAVLASIQRRRRYRPAASAITTLEPAGPPQPAVITALRRAARLPRPPAAPRSVFLATPALPGDAQPSPDPAARGQHQPGPAARGTATVTPALPDPAMIILGVRGGQEITASLPALGGLGLQGPGAPAAARAILAGLLARALPGSTSSPANVIISAADATRLLPASLQTGLGKASIPGLRVTASLHGALDRAEVEILRRARTASSHHSQTPAGPAIGSGPMTVLIATPGQADSQRLNAVLRSGRDLGVTAVVLGTWPPGTTCHVAADGFATSAHPALDKMQLFHLGGADASATISLIAEACSPAGEPAHAHPAAAAPPARGPATGRPAAPAGAAGFLIPAPSASSAGNSGIQEAARPRVPGPRPDPSSASPPARSSGQRLHPPRPRPATVPLRSPDPGTGPKATSPQPSPAATSVPVQIDILGPVRITAAGREITGGLRKARELLAFLAVHPAGVTADAISEALWPGSPPGHGISQRNLALRKAREMLRAATGRASPMWIIHASGRYPDQRRLLAVHRRAGPGPPRRHRPGPAGGLPPGGRPLPR
jgi:hypothetical protein